MSGASHSLRTGWGRTALPRLRGSRLGAAAMSLTLATLLWALVANTALRFLPEPQAVASAFVEAIGTGEFYGDFGVSMRRVFTAWAAAMLAGTALGIFMARNWIAETMVHPWVFIGIALPGPVTILLTVLVLGLGELTPLVAIWLAAAPFAANFAYDGSRSLSRPLFEAARVFHFSSWTRLRHVVLPQLAPMLFGAARFCFATSWKITVLVEALASSTGVGQQIRSFFVSNEPAKVIGWTLGFTLIMVTLEYGLFQTLERYLFRWRRTAAA